MDTLYLPNDAIAHVPLGYADQFGRSVGAPDGGEVTSSDESVGTASLSSDDTMVTITPIAETGSFTVTFRDGDLVAELNVSIGEPVAKTAVLNWQGATFEEKSDQQKEQDAKKADEVKAEEHPESDEPKADDASKDETSTSDANKDTSATGNAPIAQGQEDNPAATDHAQPVLDPTKTADPNAPVASGPAPGVAPTTPAPNVQPASDAADVTAKDGASPAAASVANTAQQPTAAG